MLIFIEDLSFPASDEDKENRPELDECGDRQRNR
jgi:hypothetical protein